MCNDAPKKMFPFIHRLLGKPALLELAKDGILIYNQRPVFCHVMIGVVLVFTGFRKKAEVVSIICLSISIYFTVSFCNYSSSV